MCCFFPKLFFVPTGVSFIPNICYSRSQVPASHRETEGPHATELTHRGAGEEPKGRSQQPVPG